MKGFPKTHRAFGQTGGWPGSGALAGLRYVSTEFAHDAGDTRIAQILV